MKKKTLPKIIRETFTIDPECGAAAVLVGLSRPGYEMKSLDRKGKKCVVTYEKI